MALYILSNQNQCVFLTPIRSSTLTGRWYTHAQRIPKQFLRKNEIGISKSKSHNVLRISTTFLRYVQHIFQRPVSADERMGVNI